MAAGWTLSVPPAQASEVRPGLAHADWATTGGGAATELKATYNIGTDPVALAWQKPPNVYWANQFFMSASSNGGYFGLQKKSLAPSKVALFSWWGALEVDCSGVVNVVNCGPFVEDGTGFQALVAFDWQASTDYTFRMWRGDHDAGRSAHWWNTEILDANGTRVASVGAMLVPTSYGGVDGVIQWSEWFAMGSEAADNCDQIPEVDTWFGSPLLDGAAATPTGIGVAYDQACETEAVWSNGGSRQRFGTSTPSTTTTTTSPPPVGLQIPRSQWMQPGRTSLDGSGTWIATGNDPTGAPGGLGPWYLYAHGFNFTANPATGVIGLVTVPGGKYAVFSVKEADGTSHDSAVAFDWKAGRFYFPLVYQVSPGVLAGWVFDHSASTWVPIGAFTLPPAWGALSVLGTTTAAWAGPAAASCSAFPLADVYFYRPTGFYAGQASEANLAGHLPTAGDCASQTSVIAGPWVRYRVGTGA